MAAVGIATSVLKDADGSGKFTLGLSAVLACINGPDQVLQQKEIIDKTYVEVHYESKSGQSSCADRKMEHFIGQVCDQAIITSMHPRTSILINVTELHEDGCLPACAVNATSLALMDAGIPMHYIVAAAACCIDDQGQVHVNPNRETTKSSLGSMTLVIESETKQILSLDTTGLLTSDQLTECITQLTSNCEELFEYFQAYVSESCS